jgi:tetratricopeptide (TPR) repeat protein
MATIQELENLNFELYTETPEDLIPIAKQLLNLNKFEKALETLEKAIQFAVKINSNDELNLDCAKFYLNYADALIRKMTESSDLLALNGENVDDKDQEDKKDTKENTNVPVVSSSNITPEKTNNGEIPLLEAIKSMDSSNTNLISNNNNLTSSNIKADDIIVEKDNESADEENDLTQQQEQEDAPETDEEVAFQNLAVAEKIFQTFLKQYDSTPAEELLNSHPAIVKTYFELSDVYQKFGELELCKSDFKAASEFFEKALEIRKKYDNKYSRGIAEIYFTLGSSYDYDQKKSLLSFYKAKLIMEYYLREELHKANLNELCEMIRVDDADLELGEVSVEKCAQSIVNSKVFLSKQQLKNENISDEIVEFISIISELNDKVKKLILKY